MAQQHREENTGRDARPTNGHHGEHGRDEQSRRQFSEQDDERYASRGYQGGMSGRYESDYPEEQGTDRRFDRPRQDEWYGSDMPSRGQTQWTREPRAQGMQGGFSRQEPDWQAGYEQGQGRRGYGERGYNEGSRYAGQQSAQGSAQGGYGQGSGRMGQDRYGSGGRYLYEQEQYQPSQNQRYGYGYGRDDDGRYRSGQSGFGSQGASGWSSGQPSSQPSAMSSSFGSSHEQPQRQSFRGKGPKGYERSDERLKEIICERLTDDDDIDASNITIEVRSGEVTLSGSVDDRRVKYQIEEVVERCGGVKDIHNNLRVSKEGRDSQDGKSEQATKSSKQQRSSVVTPSSTGN